MKSNENLRLNLKNIEDVNGEGVPVVTEMRNQLSSLLKNYLLGNVLRQTLTRREILSSTFPFALEELTTDEFIQRSSYSVSFLQGLTSEPNPSSFYTISCSNANKEGVRDIRFSKDASELESGSHAMDGAHLQYCIDTNGGNSFLLISPFKVDLTKSKDERYTDLPQLNLAGVNTVFGRVQRPDAITRRPIVSNQCFISVPVHIFQSILNSCRQLDNAIMNTYSGGRR